ncbi:LysM peptidoglycan-binding domain-containing protein [Flavobacterium gilvum]|uniref:Lytic transglycosylase n=1 Tax=Flavobacterium gilvum TaxID=1492737 RepID=A0AAC9I2A3_9FLAO|nr:LysM peptidoglycan-binding domain-containing protein [Flavobacterium gilvum]AOW08869.1 lytic transglycosylase [Flavobacterium gilvum]KFC60947.1 lytic transglycosylase [Flavobacterium gilvum]
MRLKNTTLSFFLFFSLTVFSQGTVGKTEIVNEEKPLSYLDSIKKSFVSYDHTVKADSLWMNQISSILDIYNDVDNEINTVNIDKDIDQELPTDLLKKRLAAMDAKSPFNIEYNQGLENLIKSFLKNRRKAFANQMAVAEYYFPLFEDALSKQNVPLEIKYLAVVESALNPKAVSRVGATGLWQFMYGTGKQYNLSIDSYVDERSDPLKSSEAAAQYLTNMYAVFNDWDLVLASYNSGPGNVTKAIRRSGGQQNFWNIKKYLPKETQGYVPAFLATMYIYEYHKEHGIVPKKALVKHFATDTVMVKKEMSFAQISDLLDIPVEQLQALNPSYKRNVIPSYEDKNHYLTLPSCKVAVFTSNEDKIYAYVDYEAGKREKVNTGRKPSIDIDSSAIAMTFKGKVRYYKVKRGENLGDIAKRNGIALNDLKEWNGIRGNSIAAGKSLKIISEKESETNIIQSALSSYKSKVAVANENAINKAKESKAALDKKEDTLVAENTPNLYVVQKGDNLNSIAKKYNATVAEIKEWNHLTSQNIRLGDSLQISAPIVSTETEVAVVPAPELKDIQYEVQKGDNLFIIARKFGASLTDLKQWNNLSSNSISVGNSLVVAKNAVAINTNNASVDSFKKKDNLSASQKEINYLVQKGDSLFSISKKYPGVTVSDLKKWNNITGDDLKPGMGLKIKG